MGWVAGHGARRGGGGPGGDVGHFGAAVFVGIPLQNNRTRAASFRAFWQIDSTVAIDIGELKAIQVFRTKIHSVFF
jgi:hypothetical protein